MEVSCQRCQTEYDFDDALIAERGTSVRCTTCGFEFKVLPDPGSSRQSFVVLGEDGEEHPFTSLGELQRAIARGVVRENDLLRRGSGEPRPLGSIAELVPLLRQSRSVPPPSSEAAQPDALGARHVSRTRIGLPSIADLERMRGAEPGPVSTRTPDSRPRIQSPLSQRSIPDAEPLSSPPPSPRGKLPSLSDTLLGRTSKAPLPRDSFEASVNEAPDLEAKRSSSIPPPLPVFSSAREAGSSSPSSPPRAPSLPPEVASELPRSSGRPSVHSVSDLGDARASSEPDLRERLTGSLPGKPRARLAPVVLAAIVGFGGYYLYGRFAPRSLTGQESAKTKSEGEGATPMSARELDVEGLRLRLLGKSERDVRARAQKTLEAARDIDWLVRVDLLRLAGKVDEARKLFAERSGSATGTSEGREHARSIALLDVADASAEPPWAVIAERLEEAARGEPLPYFAAAARVWALVEGERIAEAKAALHDFERFPDVASSPLLAPLVVFVRQAEETAAAATSTEHTVELSPIGISTDGAEGRTKQVVGPEVKKLVAEADAHWGAGEREPAVELYRKVFRKVGPDHFLGQKAMARIKQAERELSASGSTP